jgi:CDP-diacylglycerol--glycerol-3-phosphate 3-phosphatidyltransferase
MRLADRFSLVRVILAPVVMCLYFGSLTFQGLALPLLMVMTVILGFAEFTDFLDGYFARKLNQVSDLGKLLDPFADVILHLTTFACFAFRGYMPPVFFILILYREFSMLFIRLLSIKQGVAIAARKGGKLKTVLYVVAGFFSLALEFARHLGLFSETFGTLVLGGTVLYGVCVLLSYVSFGDYLIHFGAVLRNK